RRCRIEAGERYPGHRWFGSGKDSRRGRLTLRGAQVIIGPGNEIGDTFVTHPTPRVISFTGSTPVGRHIGELAAKASILKRVELELGGNSPFVVLHDADLDRAVEAAVFGKFLHQGQICMSVNRLIVDGSLYDAFVGRFADRVKAVKVGDPDEPDTLVARSSTRPNSMG